MVNLAFSQAEDLDNDRTKIPCRVGEGKGMER